MCFFTNLHCTELQGQLFPITNFHAHNSRTPLENCQEPESGLSLEWLLFGDIWLFFVALSHFDRSDIVRKWDDKMASPSPVC